MPTSSRKRKTTIITVLVILVIGFGGLLVYYPKDNPAAAQALTTYKVKRNDLVISVIESGNINALDSIDIKNEVEGRTTIISIVDEGMYLTQEDVEKGTILFELDSSELDERLSGQEINFATAEASYTEAREEYDIQSNQNESDINKSFLEVRFGLMDVKKYLGEVLAEVVLDPNMDLASVQEIIPALVEDPKIGGEALQKLRELKSEIDLAQEQLEQDENDLVWTRKLYEKEYATENELKKSELTVKRQVVKVDQARTALDLFIRYEFTKETEKYYSDYLEAQRELERTKAQARAKLAQALAKLKGNQARFTLEQALLQKLLRQKESCTVRAPAPGLVVYGSSGRNRRRWGGSETLIEVGAEVRERQKILSIPNLSRMAVQTSVHETSVDKVNAGQAVKITLDAFPDRLFQGQVVKVATLPDSQSSWLNPDLKVYKTEITIQGQHDFMRPGMSAQVEIIVEKLPQVLSVPVQAIVNRMGKKICYIREGTQFKVREVQTGSFNDNFIVIQTGLSEGDVVTLQPPQGIGPETSEPEETSEQEKQRLAQQASSDDKTEKQDAKQTPQ